MSEERKKYVVFKANIMDDDGMKRKDGEIVELTSKTAKHYGKLGYLRPYFEEDDEEEDDEDFDPTGMGEATPQLARSNRATSKPTGSRLQARKAALESGPGEGAS